MTRNPDRTIEQWETIAVTALPTGWRNVYKNEDGSVHVEPCPGLLLQEHRSTDRVWDEPAEDAPYRIRTKATQHEAPYDTRVVFAAFEQASLEPADTCLNYAATVGPDEDAQVYAGEAP